VTWRTLWVPGEYPVGSAISSSQLKLTHITFVALWKVTSLFQLPIKLKFPFWHFNVQALCLNLILAPIYKHSAVHVHKPNIQAMSICTTVPFIVAPITAALSHRKPESAGTSRERYRAHGRAKRDILYFSSKMKVRWFISVMRRHAYGRRIESYWSQNCVWGYVISVPWNCTFSLPATLQPTLKFCNTFHWRLSQIPNTHCVMQCSECEWRRRV